MSLKIAVQMDPLELINIDGDSSFVLILEAQKRGYEVFYYSPKDLYLLDGQVLAQAKPVEVRREKGNHFTYGSDVTLNLKSDIDIVLMRQDPPFDMSYLTATYLLDHVYPDTLVINDAFEVRNAPEKLIATHFKSLMAPTLVSGKKNVILKFYEEHKNIIIKPLHDKGGTNIFHVDEKGSNLNALIYLLEEYYQEPLMIQKFLPEAITEGDRRIVLADGEIVGSFVRVPAKGEVRGNLVQGASAKEWDMTDKDHEICKIIGPELKKRGLLFAGVDVIGGYLTEINVTSPTGLQTLNTLYDMCSEAAIWDAIEARYENNIKAAS